MRHHSLGFLLAVITAGATGCEGDVDRPTDPGGPQVEVKGTPDLNPRTDHDVDVKPGDVDVDVHRRPGQLPDVDVDVAHPPDADTRANEDEVPGTD
jgi:hypothetical protein